MWLRGLRGHAGRIVGALCASVEDMNRAKKSLLSLLVLMVVSVIAAPPQATAKPTFPFALSLAGLVGVQPTPDEGARGAGDAGAKPYSGLRRKNDSLLMIYYYDQTVAVVELGPKKLLLNCELIEVTREDNRERLLQKLGKINHPLEISFKQMVKLMWQCQQLENIGWAPYQRWLSESSFNAGPGGRLTARSTVSSRRRASGAGSSSQQHEKIITTTDAGGILESGPFSLLSGIIPGTKWCGTGDIASNYHDLGKDRLLDRCCRTHDLCPTKVRAFSNRYNLINKSLYSKSHCTCDDMLFSCLKNTNTSASQVMGSIYFNLVQVPCLEVDFNGQLRFRRARDDF